MASLQPGTVLGGRFRLHGVVGRGGSATVHLAHDLLRDERVALKVVHAHLASDPSVRRRLRREVEAAALLRGEAVLAPFDIHELDGQLALSMPFHGGRTLREHVAARGPMPADELRALGLRLAGALARAHAAGVVHRDLTPANVMVQNSGTDAVIMDFGLARTTQSAQTRSTGLLGTVGYAAPEVYDGSRADPRSDLYGLGACLYLAATGRPPFPVDHPMGALKAQLDESYTPLAEARPDLPEELAHSIEALLRADPTVRPDGAAEVRELLAGRALPPAGPAKTTDIVRQYLPPGTWTVVVRDGKHDRHRRKALRQEHRGRRTTEGELNRIGHSIVRGLKEAFGVRDEPDAPERQLVEAVAQEAGLGPHHLPLTRMVYDEKFRLVERTDEVTARRLAAAANALGFRAHAQDLSLKSTLLDTLHKYWWAVIAVGWSVFPFVVGFLSALLPALQEFIALGTVGLMTLLSVALPIFASTRTRREPGADTLAAAYTAELREITDRTGLPEPRFAVRSRRAVAEGAAAESPKPRAATASTKRSQQLRERAVSALDALDAALTERSDHLPAPALTDLRSTARDLRHAALDLAEEAARLEEALDGTALDDTDVAAIQARLDRLRTLERAGESVDQRELRQLQRALDAHARDQAALEDLESRSAAVGARLLEVCSAAHQARRDVLGARTDRVSTDDAMKRLQREVRAARQAARLIGPVACLVAAVSPSTGSAAETWAPHVSLYSEGSGRGARLAAGRFTCGETLDLVVGAYSAGIDEQGRLDFFYQREGEWVLETSRSGTPPGRMGLSLAVAQLNNDDCDDLLAGEPDRPNSPHLVGGVIGLLGTTAGFTSAPPDLDLTGTVHGDQLGSGVAFLPDVTGTGVAAWALGTPGRGDNHGEVYGQYIDGDPLGELDVFVAGTDHGRMGTTLGAADINGDGRTDLLVGASGFDESRGRLLVFAGTSEGLATTPTWSFEGDYRGDDTGQSMANLGPVAGAGPDLVALGAPEHNGDAGRVDILAYDPDTDSLVSLQSFRGSPADVSVADSIGDGLGTDILGNVDLNADGITDLVVTVRNRAITRVYYGLGDGTYEADPAVELAGGNGLASVGPLVHDAYDGAFDAIATGELGRDSIHLYIGRVDSDSDGAGDLEDCDPHDPTIGSPPAAYPDLDGDGFGTAAGWDDPCAPVPPYASVAGDCDDSDDTIHPTAQESVGDGIDQDCDGEEWCFLDADDDGYRHDSDGLPSTDFDCTAPGLAHRDAPAGDCDDTAPTVHPDAYEWPADGIDQDCDGIDPDHAPIPGTWSRTGCASVAAGGWGLVFVGLLGVVRRRRTWTA